MLHFRNEEIHELPENEKRAIDQSFCSSAAAFVIFSSLSTIRKYFKTLVSIMLFTPPKSIITNFQTQIQQSKP